MSEDTYREDKIRDMRLMLDYLEAVPEIPLPYFGTFTSYCDETHDIGEMARLMKPVEKVNSTYYFSLQRKFGTTTLDVSFEHEQVCEKIIVSTEVIPARLVEAYTKEVIEWKCPESLLDNEDAAELYDDADALGDSSAVSHESNENVEESLDA